MQDRNDTGNERATAAPVAAVPRLGAEPGTYDDFTIDRFLPRVGEVFHVVGEASEPIAILLSEITRLASDDSPIRTRMPFSLVFHAPPGVRLEQQIYRVENPEMEPFDCFLVPIGPDPFGMRFEAVYT